MSAIDTIIIGAGITGLAAARKLRSAGRDVLVLEAGETLGHGRITRVEHSGDMADAGAQLIHSNYSEMLQLIDSCGLSSQLIKSDGATSYLDRTGTPRLSRGPADLARLVSVKGNFDLARFYAQMKLSKPFSTFEISKNIPAYDNISAADAFSWAGEEFFDFVLRPMMHASTNTTPDQTNYYHTLNLLRLVSTTETFGLRHGILSLLERLAEQVPVAFGSRVESLVMTGDRVDGVQLADGRSLAAKHVIVACPLGAAARLMPEPLAEARRFLSEFPYTPLPLVFFFLDRPLSRDTFVYMGHPYRETVYNMAVNHAGRAEMVPSGKAIISCWAAYPSTVTMDDLDDDATIKQALHDLDAFIPGVAGWVDHAQVMKHRPGIARYEPGTHSKIIQFKEYAESLKGVSFAGNDYDSVHMESGIRSGYRAVVRAEREIQ